MAPRTLGLLVFAALAAGCGVKDPSQISLKIAPASITVVNPSGERHVLAMASSGEVTLDGNRVFSIRGDGRIRVYPKLGFQLTKDDTILQSGQKTNAAIRGDGTFVLDGADQLHYDSKGGIIGALLSDSDHELVKAHATVTYDGPPEAHRAMMFAFAVLLTHGPQMPPPPS